MANSAAKRNRTWVLGFWACEVEGGFSTVLEEIDGVLEVFGASVPSPPIARLPDDRHRTHDVLEWQGKATAVRVVSFADRGRLELTRLMFELMDRLKKHYPSSFPDMALLGMACEISNIPSPGEGFISPTSSIVLWIPEMKDVSSSTDISFILPDDARLSLAKTREVQEVVAASPEFVFKYLASGDMDELLRPFLGRATARVRCRSLDKSLPPGSSGGLSPRARI